YLLHAKYGHKRWDQVVAPAEALARRGVPASRAFVRRLAPMADKLLADPVARQVFARADGQPLGEGDILRNGALGTALGRISQRGVGEFYSGSWSNEVAGAMHQAGSSIRVADLRAFSPAITKPIAVPFGHDMAYFAPPPAGSGLMEAVAWAYLAGDG